MLVREYTDLNGIRRKATFLENGPAGKRWRMEDGSILTIDWVMRDGKLWYPWTAAKELTEYYEESSQD